MFVQRKKSKDKEMYSRFKNKSPRVPSITCPAIDELIQRMEKLESKGKPVSARNVNAVKRQLEKLRTANEKLRESGIYWNKATKKLIDRFLAKKKKPNIW